MHRTATTLSDGRELIYYHRSPLPAAPPADRRALPDRPATSEVRQDPTTGDWVMIAGHRQGRTFQPVAQACPLCPSRDGRLTEVPAPGYEVVVFENRFPALVGPPGGGPGPGLLRAIAGGGRCEVICFAEDHETSLAALAPEQVGLVLAAWIDRTGELGGRDDVRQVFCFENRGPEMGVTQPHPHGQIYAFPYVTPRTTRMLARARAHRRELDRNLFDDLVAAELADGRRVVSSTPEWVAFVPYAARWPYEVHLYPRRRRRDLTALDEAQRAEFPGVYLDLLGRFDRLFDRPAPYVSAWHQAPVVPGAGDFALHLALFTNRRAPDRLKLLGATEVAMEAFSNDIGPEPAAARLRELAA